MDLASFTENLTVLIFMVQYSSNSTQYASRIPCGTKVGGSFGRDSSPPYRHDHSKVYQLPATLQPVLFWTVIHKTQYHFDEPL